MQPNEIDIVRSITFSPVCPTTIAVGSRMGTQLVDIRYGNRY